MLPGWDLFQVPAQNALIELQLTGKLTPRLIKYARCMCWTSSAIWYDGGDVTINNAFIEAAEQNFGKHPAGDDPIQNYSAWKSSH